MPNANKESVTYVCGHCHIQVRTKMLSGVPDNQNEEHGPLSEWVLTSCSGCNRPNLLGREYYGD